MKQDIKRFFPLLILYVKPYKKRFVLLYVLTLLYDILALLPIFYMGKIINYVSEKNYTQILYTIGILAVLFLINSVFNIGQTYYTNWLNCEITKKIKNDIYMKANKLKMRDYFNETSGHIMSLIEGDAMIISDFFVSKTIGIVVAFITLSLSLLFLFKLSASLTVIAIIAFPLGFIGSLLCGKKINTKSEKSRKLSDETYSFLNKTLNGVKEIKAYAIEKKVVKQFKMYSEQIQKYNMSVSVLEIKASIFNSVISSVAEWIIIGYGTWKIICGKMLIGSYVAFNGYLGLLFNAINELLKGNITFRTASASLERVNNFLALKDEKESCKKKDVDFESDIVFDNVRFAYNQDQILRGFSGIFKKNTISVVVGHNGVGKSTLFSLIEHFFIPQEGDVLIGKININDIDINVLRDNIGMVQQHPMMLGKTLRDNLVYGVDDVSENMLNDICMKVGLCGFVERLPLGFDTNISEISGGEKQKIAIARALVKNPSILLLDEITSDLDGEQEKQIVGMLIELAKEKTIILISHRSNAIINIPNIYVMENGKIIDKGNHKELIENCPLYSVLVSVQEGI